jgi:hypothetical protein
MKLLKYAQRTLTLAYVFGWSVWATSKIGEPPSGMSWIGAWSFAGVIAAAALLGWSAGKESAND